MSKFPSLNDKYLPQGLNGLEVNKKLVPFMGETVWNEFTPLAVTMVIILNYTIL